MQKVIAFIAAAHLLMVTAPPASANVTGDQLTDLCRPQLQTFVQELLNERPSEDTMSEDPAEAADQAAKRAEAAREKASLRANGLNDPLVRQLVDHMRTDGAKVGKAAIRKDLSDMKTRIREAGVTDGRGQGPDTAVAFVATCLMDAILADMEGPSPATSQSASAAAVAARNKTAIPPLRPTAALEAHNPANEASQCLELITKKDFERRGIKSAMGAVFNNRCAYPVETRWCIGADRCTRLGYDNLATMPASDYRSISYDAPVGVKNETRWAACRQGFAHRPDFVRTLHYACK